MISGRRPRRPDGQYYRQRRKTGRTGIASLPGASPLVVGAALAGVAVVALAAWWML